MSGAPQYVYFFGDGSSEGDPSRTDLLGGKGASLAAMSRAGFPVPPGFTISSECCALVEAGGGRWPDGLEAQVRAALKRLETATGREFGRGTQPLLVAVRSGAGVSMPGMMDTILNCGLTPASGDVSVTAGQRREGNVAESNGHHTFWKDFAEHVRMFAASVAGLKLEETEQDSALERPNEGHEKREVRGDESPHSPARTRALRWVVQYEDATGRSFPRDPWDALRECIDAVFASWNSERARAYRQHHDVRGLAGTAVNVQSMFPSERSGVLFTVNPQAPDAGEMILEASWGLGEAVVSGAVTPDIYAVDRATLAIRRTIAGDRPSNGHVANEAHGGSVATATDLVLNEEQVREIAALGRRVEDHFRVPSDVEWGIAGGKVALLQTRGIRGLDVLRTAEELRRCEVVRLQELAGEEHVVWVAHNLGETLPHPTPLTWDVVRWFMSGRGGFGRLYRTLGFRPSRAVDEHGFLELILGRIYVDPLRAAGLFWGDLPYEYDAREILADRQALERPPTKLNFERADPLLFLKIPRLVWSMLRSSRTMRRLRAARQDGRVRIPTFERFETVCRTRLEPFLAEAAAKALPSLSVNELLVELDRRIEFVLGDFAAESLLPGFFGGVALEELRQWLVQILGEERGAELCARLTGGLEGDVTVEQNARLFDVARGESGACALAGFLKEFGHRAVEEMELAQPRWREDSSFLDRMLPGLRADGAASPAERHAAQAALRRQAEAELPELLRVAGASSLRESVELSLAEAQTLLPFRETGKFHLMRGYETIREVLVELSNRFGLGRDVFYLLRDDLRGAESHPDHFRGLAGHRKSQWLAAQKLTIGEVIDSRHLADFGRPPPRKAAGSGHYEARPIAAGASKGTARIVHRPGEARDLGTGYMLVCPSTDPGWTPLFLHCRGLVVERGGILSHGAIVARDFGIPAVVLENATQLIADGSTIEIDAHTGSVTVVAGKR